EDALREREPRERRRLRRGDRRLRRTRGHDRLQRALLPRRARGDRRRRGRARDQRRARPGRDQAREHERHDDVRRRRDADADLSAAIEPRRVAFRRIAVSGFRNLADAELIPGPGLTLITGDNGQGKTSLLEAFYFVATSRSFRTEKLVTLVQQGRERLGARAEIEEGARTREQRAEIVRGTRRVAIDGKRPKRLVDYALRTPGVAFHPGDLELVSGAPSVRSPLLERVAFFGDPPGYDARGAYEKAVKERQRVLEERGERAPDLEAYEPLIAEHGARFQAARTAAAQALIEHLVPAFARI